MSGRGTRVRYLSSKDPKELEDLLEVLPFKVEIKAAYPMGKIHWLVLTLADGTSLTKDVIDRIAPGSKISIKEKRNKL